MNEKSLKPSYLAGFLDGDGSIGLTWSGGGESKRRRNQITPIPTVTFSQRSSKTSDDLFKKIYDMYGGYLELGIETDHSDMNRYELRHRDELRTFLKDIVPYLKVKKEQGKILLQIVNLLADVKQGIPTKESILVKVAKLGEKLDELNHPKHPKTWTYAKTIEKIRNRERDQYGRFKRGNQRFWLDREVKFLKENYEKLSWKRLKAELHRSKKSITSKANDMGLTRRKLWTKDELETLKEFYLQLHWDELEEKFSNRTKSAIQSKALELGLKRRGNIWG